MPQLRPADQVDFTDFLAAFNASYQDYFVPIHMEHGAMQSLIKRDSIQLSASWVAQQDTKTVGVGMLAIRGDQGWIGGLGVIPEARHTGIGRTLTEALLQSARERDLREVYLEVLEENTIAQKLYESLGFKETRRLLILERKPTIDDLKSTGPYAIEDVWPEDVFPYYAAFHRVPNPWQRRLESLEALADSLEAWLVRRDGEVIAYVMGWVQTEIIRLMDIAAAPDSEAGAAVLLDHLHNMTPFANASLINMPMDDPMEAVLYNRGYRKTRGQREMVFTLR